MACCWKISNSWIKLTSLIWISIKGVVRPMLDKKKFLCLISRDLLCFKWDLFTFITQVTFVFNLAYLNFLFQIKWSIRFESKNIKHEIAKPIKIKSTVLAHDFFFLFLRKWYNNLIATSCPNSNQGTLPIIPRQQLKVWKIFFVLGKNKEGRGAILKIVDLDFFITLLRPFSYLAKSGAISRTLEHV